MSDLARGPRARRGGRKTGWLLLTALLVLALLASSTLVFTSRVELLRLAVILSLWAAVLAAFVSVMYRRQSQAEQARARDMKFVYDLQLDREISARREYELSVEAHLRRQLEREMRAQAADEMAALRAELVSLRANLEVLLGADLGDRPALESDRESVAEPLAMTMPPPPGRVESSRVTMVFAEETSRRRLTEAITEEVTEAVIEEVVEEVVEEVPQEDLEASLRAAERAAAERAAAEHAAAQRAAAQRAAAERAAAERAAAERAAAERAAIERAAAERAAAERAAAERAAVPSTPGVPAAPRMEQPSRGTPEPQGPGYRGSHRRPEAPAAPWRPPETGSRRSRHSNAESTPTGSAARAAGPVASVPPPPRGRHWVEPAAAAPAGSVPGEGRRRAPEPQETPTDHEARGQHAGGSSVADLMARLQPGPQDGGQGGGGRRRRED